jgi:hypothetical protein
MSISWDELLKMLARANPQDILSLVSQDTHYLNDITQELITRSIRADVMLKPMPRAASVGSALSNVIVSVR